MRVSGRFKSSAERAARCLAGIWADEGGLTYVEYALLLALLGGSALMAFGGLGAEVDTIAREGSDTLEDAAGMGCAPQ